MQPVLRMRTATSVTFLLIASMEETILLKLARVSCSAALPSLSTGVCSRNRVNRVVGLLLEVVDHLGDLLGRSPRLDRE